MAKHDLKIAEDGQRLLPYHSMPRRKLHAATGWIEGLNKLAPFATVQWGNDVIYTTPGLRREDHSVPEVFFYNNGVQDRRGGNYNSCLGSIMSRLKGEELEQFEQNLPQILELLEEAVRRK
jgi:hypothetical protein